MAKVSICIPTYNNLTEVERLLSSIVEQTYTDYEIIISDDSTDDHIRRMVTEQYSGRLRYYHNETPLGHIFNWNKALSYATGEYVKIMFSDDWFTGERSLALLVDMLEQKQAASMAFCGSMQVSPGKSYGRAATAEYISNLQEDYRYLFLGNQIGAPSATIYRRSLNVWFDEQSNWASDVFLYFEILKSNPIFAWTDKPLISIGLHEHQYTESFSKRDKRVFEDYRYLYMKYGLSDSAACKEHFLTTYMLPYHKGFVTAGQCGYGVLEYGKRYFPYLWTNVICSYGQALGKKMKRILNRHE